MFVRVVARVTCHGDSFEGDCQEAKKNHNKTHHGAKGNVFLFVSLETLGNVVAGGRLSDYRFVKAAKGALRRPQWQLGIGIGIGGQRAETSHDHGQRRGD